MRLRSSVKPLVQALVDRRLRIWLNWDRRSFILFGLMTVELKSQNTFSLQFPVVKLWSQTKAVTGRFFLRTHFRLIDIKITSAQ